MGDAQDNRRSCCLLILYELALVVLAFCATANHLNRAHTHKMWEILTASGLATAAAVYVGSAALSVLLLPDVFFNPQLVRLPLWLEDEPHTVMANQLVLGSLATCLWSFGLGGIISAFQSRGVFAAVLLALATATITYLYAGALRWAEKEDGNLGCIGTLVFHFHPERPCLAGGGSRKGCHVWAPLGSDRAPCSPSRPSAICQTGLSEPVPRRQWREGRWGSRKCWPMPPKALPPPGCALPHSREAH